MNSEAKNFQKVADGFEEKVVQVSRVSKKELGEVKFLFLPWWLLVTKKVKLGLV
jgi:hypothetical protein